MPIHEKKNLQATMTYVQLAEDNVLYSLIGITMEIMNNSIIFDTFIILSYWNANKKQTGVKGIFYISYN